MRFVPNAAKRDWAPASPGSAGEPAGVCVHPEARAKTPATVTARKDLPIFMRGAFRVINPASSLVKPRSHGRMAGVAPSLNSAHLDRVDGVQASADGTDHHCGLALFQKSFL